MADLFNVIKKKAAGQEWNVKGWDEAKDMVRSGSKSRIKTEDKELSLKLWATALEYKEIIGGNVASGKKALHVYGAIQGAEIDLPDRNANGVIDENERQMPGCKLFGDSCMSFSNEQVNKMYGIFKDKLAKTGNAFTHEEHAAEIQAKQEDDQKKIKAEMDGFKMEIESALSGPAVSIEEQMRQARAKMEHDISSSEEAIEAGFFK